jgi:hypothetical protein
MRPQSATDHRVAALAERQGGIVAHAQLRSLGLGAAAIQRRVRAGRLHPRFRGVYAVGHRHVGPEGLLWAAVLACGPGAVVSHVSAAAAWDMLASAARTVDVTVGLGGRKRRRGLRLHRTRALADDEVTTLRGLPITTPARTLLDLGATGLNAERLAAALDRAELIHRLDFAQLHELLARHRGRPGTRSLKAQLERYRGSVDVRSHLERLIYQLCDDHGLPHPWSNISIEGKVRDFYWPRCRLVVEADSYAWHRSPSALNEDRERDVELTLAGYHVLRFTYEQVTRRPRWVAQTIQAALLRFEVP